MKATTKNPRLLGPALPVPGLVLPFILSLILPLIFSLIFSLAPTALSPALAAVDGGPAASAWAETEQTALRLIAASETTGGQERLKFGLHFKLKPGWKIYWRSPGDAGFPPEPDWSASVNLKSATLRWPAPERFSILGLETLGYTNEVVLPMSVEPVDPAKPLRMEGDIRYLACKEICIPYEAKLALALPPGDIGGPARLSPFAHLIDRFRAKVPGAGGRSGLNIESAGTWTSGRDTLLRVTATATLPFRAPDLFLEGPPENPQVLSFSKPVVSLSPDGRTARLDVKVFGLDYLTGPPTGAAEKTLSGRTLAGRLLTVTLVDGNRAAEKRLTAQLRPGPVSEWGGGGGWAKGGQGVRPFALILALAVLGGLILNLMPCVLPVLSIKLLGLAGHGGGERRTVRLSFVASSAGILFAFLVLAGALVALKAAGMTVGWGIQFQQPWFLIAMTLLVAGFACNLWGAFEFRLPRFIASQEKHTSHVHGLGGHFLQGAFATLLATPCSAPFLGTAVGFALARGPVEIFSIFAALGLGLALPFLSVAAFPGLATRLPKPGPWMVTFRRFLGLALAATAVWLLSVLAAVIGFNAALLVGVLTLGGAGLLFLGRLWPDGAGLRMPAGLVLTAVAAFLVPGWLGEAPKAGAEAGAGGGPGGNVLYGAVSVRTLDRLWQPFDETAIPRLVARGKTVFVDVTADWCITCQVNKAFVLSNEAVLEALRDGNMVAMQADWTRPDPVISAYLARHQRYGIPFDAVYGPGAPAGILLPELLSRDAVLDAIAKAGGGKAPDTGKVSSGKKPKKTG